MSAGTRLSTTLVLVGYIGSWSVVSAAPAPPKPETTTATRTRAELTRNREALRKVMTAQAHGVPTKHPTPGRYGALVSASTAARHGAPGVPNASEAHGPIAARAIPGQAMATPKSGAVGTVPASLNHPRIAPLSGALGGPVASNTLTPIHHSPAAPVTLGGAPVRRNAGYSAIDGSVFHHKP